jgi:hypothetical protein
MARVYALLLEGALQSEQNLDSLKVKGLAAQSIQWYRTCITEADTMHAAGMKGQSLMGLGRVLKVLDQKNQARETLIESITVLDRLGSVKHLEAARALLDSL